MTKICFHCPKCSTQLTVPRSHLYTKTICLKCSESLTPGDLNWLVEDLVPRSHERKLSVVTRHMLQRKRAKDEQLAQEINQSVHYVRDLKKGLRVPDWLTLLRIGKVLQIPLEAINLLLKRTRLPDYDQTNTSISTDFDRRQTKR